MRKLRVFESITANGFFAGPDGDLSWAHDRSPDPEFQAFVSGNASTPGVLLFGRVTYEMMVSYWPTPQAAADMPVVANGMNAAEKLVFSRTLRTLDWSNASLVSGDLPTAIHALKESPGRDITVLGSGSIVTQLADAALVDEYQFVVKPIILGAGRTLFDGLTTARPLELRTSRVFRDGNVVLTYAPVS